MVGTLISGLLLVVQGQSQQASLRDASPAAGLNAVAVAVPARPAAPRIDGVLDDVAWQAAVPLSGFRQAEPDEGVPASERTEVRVLYGEDAFFFGVRAYDSRPDEIAAQLSRRDQRTPSDQVGIIIDSYYDRRTAFEFTVNPLGVKMDVYHFNNSDFDLSWDAVWQVKTRRDSLGWTAEFRIPYSQLRFAGEEQDRVGFNVYRVLNRRNEMSWWRPIPRSSNGFVSEFGELAGLEEIKPRKRLEIVPYTLAQHDRFPAGDNPFESGGSTSGTLGGDVRAGLTSWLNLSGTINPDFGQVEADPAEVNLSAFESFFPERRPFFTEGVDLFAFSIARNQGSPEQLFYSRRIGRAPQVEPDDRGGYAESVLNSRILGAAKLTGKTPGGWSVSALTAVTDKATARVVDSVGVSHRDLVEPRAGYLVARLGRELREGQTVLSLFGTGLSRSNTDRTASELHQQAWSLGADFNHRFSGDTHRLQLWAATSRVSGSREAILKTQESSARYFQRPDQDFAGLDSNRTSLSGAAASLALSKYSGGSWLWELKGVTRSPGFEVNDLGFQQWAGETWADGMVTKRWLTPNSTFRRAYLRGRAATGWTYGGERINSAMNLTGGMLFNNYWSVNVSLWNRLGGTDPKVLRGGPALRETGNYFAFLGVDTDDRKRVQLLADVSGWKYYGANRWSFRTGAEVLFRLSDRQSFSLAPRLSIEQDDQQYLDAIDVAGDTQYFLGDVRRTEVSMQFRGNLTFTPDLSLQLYGEPFISSGQYLGFKRVVRPGAAEYQEQFEQFGEDQIIRGPDGTVAVDLDGNGQADADLGQPDFTNISFRSNAVLRWEYRPGSTLFLVWQHDRSAESTQGRFDLGRGARSLVNTPGRNVLLVKLSYWLNLR